MLSQKFSIKGRYLKAPNRRVYLRLTVSGLPDSERHHASGLRRRNSLGLPANPRQSVLSQAEHQADPRTAQFARSGPEDRRLRQPRRWASPGRKRCCSGCEKRSSSIKREDGELDGKKVWILHGTWRTARDLLVPMRSRCRHRRLAPVYPDGSPRSTSARTTAGLTSSSSWAEGPPCFDTRRVGPDGRPIGPKSTIEQVEPSKITLAYSDVKLNATIRVDEFAFQAPPSANVDDNTEVISKGLDQAIQVQVQQEEERGDTKEGASARSIDRHPAAA